MMTARFFLLAGIVCAVVVGCGRKQRGVYSFPEKQSIKINKLTLPSVKGLTATTQQKRVTLVWKPLEVQAGVRLVGYHVYRLAQGRFIPKQPITKKPVTSTTHVDKRARKSAKDGVVCYVVRGVFEIDGQVIQGLTSQVVAVSLK
jgi:hypothetical protein